jgi:predicted component of type VI protein secretion system
MTQYSFATLVTEETYPFFGLFYQFYRQNYALPLYVVTHCLRKVLVDFLSTFDCVITVTLDVENNTEQTKDLAIKQICKLVHNCIFLDVECYILKDVNVLFKPKHSYVKSLGHNKISLISKNGNENEIYDLYHNDELISSANKRFYHFSESLFQAILNEHKHAHIIDFSGVPVPLLKIDSNWSSDSFKQFKDEKARKIILVGCGAFVEEALLELRSILRMRALIHYDKTYITKFIQLGLADYNDDHYAMLSLDRGPFIVYGGLDTHLIKSRIPNDCVIINIINQPLDELRFMITNYLHGLRASFELDIDSQNARFITNSQHHPYIKETPDRSLIDSLEDRYRSILNYTTNQQYLISSAGELLNILLSIYGIKDDKKILEKSRDPSMDDFIRQFKATYETRINNILSKIYATAASKTNPIII